MTSPTARQAFDLDREAPALRDRYGRNEYGESFLLARRLVEAGVRLVSVIWMYFIPDGRLLIAWDAHGGLEGLGKISGFDMLKAEYGLPPLDRAYPRCWKTCTSGPPGRDDGGHDRRVWPHARINQVKGRDHWGLYSVVLAGGGGGGGQVYGASDKVAAYPKDNPVAPEDLLATIYQAMGIPSQSEIIDREGRPVKVCDGKAVEAHLDEPTNCVPPCSFLHGPARGYPRGMRSHRCANSADVILPTVPWSLPLAWPPRLPFKGQWRQGGGARFASACASTRPG